MQKKIEDLNSSQVFRRKHDCSNNFKKLRTKIYNAKFYIKNDYIMQLIWGFFFFFFFDESVKNFINREQRIQKI